MSPVWRRTLALLSVLLLAGCFQQAGESLQSGGNVPLDVPSATPDLGLTAAPDLALTTSDTLDATATPPVIITIDTTLNPNTGPATSTIPPLTIIVPTSTSAVLPSLTPLPDIGTPTQETGTFITPGISLGPAVTITTPTPGAGIPTATPSGLITPTALDLDNPDIAVEVELDPEDECTYEVEAGDTVYRIALSFDTSVDAMREANPDLTGDNPVIHPGDVLRIPDCEPGVEGDENAFGITAIPSQVAPIIAPVGQTTTPVAIGNIYAVQRGDTLFTIAQRFGVTMASIVEANGLDNPDSLSIGQELVIPEDSP
jgi:LysM repeat protein